MARSSRQFKSPSPSLARGVEGVKREQQYFCPSFCSRRNWTIRLHLGGECGDGVRSIFTIACPGKWSSVTTLDTGYQHILSSSYFSLWGGARHLRPHHDHRISPAHRGLPPPLPPLRGEGGPGVREGRHLQAGPAVDRRSSGSGGLLHHSLCWYLREDWLENSDLRDPSTGGIILTTAITDMTPNTIH